ncbi:MAG: hypothetical protein M3164_04515 [Actinomycetota bacterium]|nr:hypothetical protein [Actinomycetota bacterium]
MPGPPANFASLLRARRGYLGSHSPEGVAEVLPVCFTWAGGFIWIPIEAGDVTTEAVLSIADGGGRICFLVDRWDEDWTKLAWLQAWGWATLLEDDEEAQRATQALTSKYTQYLKKPRELVIVRLEVEEWRVWEPNGGS